MWTHLSSCSIWKTLADHWHLAVKMRLAANCFFQNVLICVTSNKERERESERYNFLHSFINIVFHTITINFLSFFPSLVLFRYFFFFTHFLPKNTHKKTNLNKINYTRIIKFSSSPTTQHFSNCPNFIKNHSIICHLIKSKFCHNSCSY